MPEELREVVILYYFQEIEDKRDCRNFGNRSAACEI